MVSTLKKISCAFALLNVIQQAQAFCGFYVARADAKLYNQASQVVITRNEGKTVLTMANDFKGPTQEFAVVIPVPTFIEREQIHVTNQALIDHVDGYSAPRLVEYFDSNPCDPPILMDAAPMSAMRSKSMESAEHAKSLGVKIEASYTVGEYDILILSAQESSGLVTWLRQNDYKIPEGAEAIVGSYLKQGMRFFVAKVNLEKQVNLGFNYLRPLQVAFNSPKFMLPIRLGTLNANGPQELFIYAITPNGRVETTNYRTVKLPTDLEVPSFVKAEFGQFYRNMFLHQTQREGNNVVFTEYAWNMSSCDPCAADPLSAEELKEFGVFWTADMGSQPQAPTTRFMPPPQAQNVFLTRLHVRYDQAHFPEDLVFQETGDQSNFQGRYIIRHEWQGVAKCPEAERYQKEELPLRHQQQSENLANLLGWDRSAIQRKMNFSTTSSESQSNDKWWRGMWKADQ